MTRLSPSSLLFAVLAFSQACIALVSAAELTPGGQFKIQQLPFYFDVPPSDGDRFNVVTDKTYSAIWKLERGHGEGSFTLQHDGTGRYLTVLGMVAESSRIGIAPESFDWSLVNSPEGTNKYRISPSSATGLTIQMVADSYTLSLQQPSPGQQPGGDEWSFVESK